MEMVSQITFKICIITLISKKEANFDLITTKMKLSHQSNPNKCSQNHIYYMYIMYITRVSMFLICGQYFRKFYILHLFLKHVKEDLNDETTTTINF